MKRIKVFTHSRHDMENRINEWIDVCKPADIISVTPSISANDSSTYCIITVLYEDGKVSL